MEVQVIRTEADYRATLARVSDLIDLDPAPDTPEGEALEVLGTLVEAYEREHHPIDPPAHRGHQIPPGATRPEPGTTSPASGLAAT